ncbi:MAG: hypothetical protein H8D45_00875 [Bacteroidetes bacterium]|nr:hypothetical protein [Bacteroidota bacterium]
MKKIIEYFFTTILGLGFIWIEFGGLYHSFKKHSLAEGVIATFIPPVAWYRSVEFFWHDDFANINWDIKLSDDINTCVYFLNEYISPEANIYSLNIDIDNFSKQIMSYPEVKRLDLKQAVEIYIEYVPSAFDDFVNSVKKSTNTDGFSLEYSKKTSELERKLIAFGITDIEHYKEIINLSYSQFSFNDNDSTKKAIEQISNALGVVKGNYNTSFNQTLSRIFRD